MILNKEIVIEGVIEVLDLNCDERPKMLNEDLEYLYDLCLKIDIHGLNPEINSIMYGELLNILNLYGSEIAEEIDKFIEEEFYSYFGDPAFSSASDYWNYILGDG